MISRPLVVVLTLMKNLPKGICDFLKNASALLFIYPLASFLCVFSCLSPISQRHSLPFFSGSLKNQKDLHSRRDLEHHMIFFTAASFLPSLFPPHETLCLIHQVHLPGPRQKSLKIQHYQALEAVLKPCLYPGLHRRKKSEVAKLEKEPLGNDVPSLAESDERAVKNGVKGKGTTGRKAGRKNVERILIVLLVASLG